MTASARVKRRSKQLWLLVIFALFAAACNGGSESAEPSPTPTPTEAVDSEPTETAKTPTPVPQVSDEQRVNAAIALLEADAGAGGELSGLIAFDYIEGEYRAETDTVSLKVCGWGGDTVFDHVYESIHNSGTNDNGQATAKHISTAQTTGECQNTHLIESAIAVINDFEVYWSSVAADPRSFRATDEGAQLLTPSYLDASADFVTAWIEDDLYLLIGTPAGTLPRDVAAEVLLGQREIDDELAIEIVVCRAMNTDAGFYRNDVLLDDRKPIDPGPHAVDAYTLVPTKGESGEWRIANAVGLDWSDCLRDGDWIGAAENWRESSGFEVVRP